METKQHNSVLPGTKQRQSPRNTVQRTAKKMRLSHEPTISETTNYAQSEQTAGNDPRKLTTVEEKVIKELIEIRKQARPFEGEIEKFEELEGSDKHYYIEESLRRLIDKLDEMFDDIGPNQFLRDERKKVYKVIFPLFQKLDNKVEENRKKTLLTK